MFDLNQVQHARLFVYVIVPRLNYQFLLLPQQVGKRSVLQSPCAVVGKNQILLRTSIIDQTCNFKLSRNYPIFGSATDEFSYRRLASTRMPMGRSLAEGDRVRSVDRRAIV